MAINKIFITEPGIRVALHCKNNAVGVNFTAFGIGSGENMTPERATALTSEEKRIPVTSVKKINDEKYRIRGELSNNDIYTNITFRELGLYATDPETGAEILYCYGNAKGDGYDYTENLYCFDATGVARSRIFEVDIFLDNNLSPTFTIDNSGKADIATVNEIIEDMQDLQEEVEKIKGNFINIFYPVGSIYWSRKPTNPGDFMGGVWKQIKDTFILAAGDTYGAGTTGGNATTLLTVENLPSHSHGLNEHTHGAGTLNTGGMSENSTGYFCNGRIDWYGGWYGGGNVSNGGSIGATSGYDAGSGGYRANIDVSHTHTISGITGQASGNTTATGSGSAINNMPPYMTMYCWERVS